MSGLGTHIFLIIVFLSLCVTCIVCVSVHLFPYLTRVCVCVCVCVRALLIIFKLKVVLETEVTNENALRLYERLGFCRDKRLVRYYMNDVDALRLKLWLT